MNDFSHEVKNIHSNRGPKKKGENKGKRKELIFSMAKWLLSVGIRTNGDGVMEVGFLIIILKRVETPLSIETRDPLVRWTNGKATSRVTIGSIGHRFGIYSGPEKRLLSFGQFGMKLLLLMSGGLALGRLQFPSNVYFASLTQASRLNINFGTTFKLGEHGDGPLSLCMNFVG